MKHFITFILLCCAAFVFGQKAQLTNAKLDAATVYFNAAELNHYFSANLVKGTNEIVVKNIANYLNENTIRILAPKNVTVLSVRFTTQYTSNDKDNLLPKSKQVKDSIDLLTTQIEKLKNQIAAEKQVVDLIKENKAVLGGGTGLNVAEYAKFIEFSKDKMTASLDKIDAMTDKQNKLRTFRYDLEQRLKGEVGNEETLSKGKLVLQVMSDTPVKADFSVSYITPSASWHPFYDLRAENINQPINLVYKAQVRQNTGVDWKHIKLNLSSGNPNQNNQITLLRAWYLYFGSPQEVAMYDVTANVYAKRDAPQVLKEVAVEEATIGDYTNVSENQLNTSFDITTPYDILSNNKEHSVSLKEFKVKAKYEYYAAPRVDNGVYLVASIDDYSQYNLLTGQANIIFEDMYVGKTLIDPNQTTESMQLTMGNDKKISIKREKIADKSETKFISSYKEQTFTYEITVKNNKKEAIDLKLKDQYPLSTNDKIQIELLEASKASVNKETGILTWDTNLKAGETKKFRISYKVKYPKNEVIGNL